MWQVALDEADKESDNVILMSAGTFKLIREQLQRLKQDNENLKKEVKQIRTYEELKLKKYKQALEEIREIVTGNYDVLEPQAKKDIENKINEVIG